MRGSLAVLVGIVLLLYGYRLYALDPHAGGFLPCPFRYLTGLQCPGCGSQRALHDLMHGRFTAAIGDNALLVLALPLLIVQWGLGKWWAGHRPPAQRNVLVFAWLILVVAWGVVRNL